MGVLTPLVTCIMPTSGRRRFVPGAIRCFLEQDYPARELVILDDGPDFIGDLVPADPRIRYERCLKMNVGQKRNMAAGLAAGDLIAHWDDDDWSAPGRLSDQVSRITSASAQMTGYRQMIFTDGNSAWVYHGKPLYCVGTSFMYAADFWRAHPFRPLAAGEDNAFLQSAARIAVADGLGMMVARIHRGNTCQKAGMAFLLPQWTPMQLSSLPEGFIA